MDLGGSSQGGGRANNLAPLAKLGMLVIHYYVYGLACYSWDLQEISIKGLKDFHESHAAICEHRPHC